MKQNAGNATDIFFPQLCKQGLILIRSLQPLNILLGPNRIYKSRLYTYRTGMRIKNPTTEFKNILTYLSSRLRKCRRFCLHGVHYKKSWNYCFTK